MSSEPSERLLRLAGWLLTPFVVWAVSFFGGWLGAIIGERTGSFAGGMGWLVAGAVLGGVLALVGWVWLMRQGTPRRTDASR